MFPDLIRDVRVAGWWIVVNLNRAHCCIPPHVFSFLALFSEDEFGRRHIDVRENCQIGFSSSSTLGHNATKPSCLFKMCTRMKRSRGCEDVEIELHLWHGPEQTAKSRARRDFG